MNSKVYNDGLKKNKQSTLQDKQEKKAMLTFSKLSIESESNKVL